MSLRGNTRHPEYVLILNKNSNRNKKEQQKRNMFVDHWGEKEGFLVLDLFFSPNTKNMKSFSRWRPEQTTCSLEGRANCVAKAGGGARGAPINVALGPARGPHTTQQARPPQRG